MRRIASAISRCVWARYARSRLLRAAIIATALRWLLKSIVTQLRTSSITAMALISSVLGMRMTSPVSWLVNWLCSESLPLMNGMP